MNFVRSALFQHGVSGETENTESLSNNPYVSVSSVSLCLRVETLSVKATAMIETSTATLRKAKMADALAIQRLITLFASRGEMLSVR